MKFGRLAEPKKPTRDHYRWAGAMALSAEKRLGVSVYPIVYAGPDGFPVVELRVNDSGPYYHADYLSSMADTAIRQIRARSIIKDLEKHL